MTSRVQVSRRGLLAQGGVACALAALDLATHRLLAATGPATARAPSIFVGHGSPMNAIEDNAFTRTLRQWGTELGRPKAILSVSAHWLTRGETLVDAQMKPRTIHDFGGFPRELHEMQYPAVGAPLVAAGLVQSVGARPSTQWGLDHGTWTVLHHLFPQADIPVLQLSIDYDKPGAFHLDMGRRLAALRDRGVLVMGSGNVVHNLQATQRGAPESRTAGTAWAQSFDDRVAQALEARDDAALVAYSKLDAGAGMAVPTPDHYWPLLHALGAALPREKPKTRYASFQSGTLSMRCVQFG